MKAIAKKINGEWIAEVSDREEGFIGDQFFRPGFNRITKYSIIGDTSGFKEGDEIDGNVQDFYDRDERTVFELTTHREALEKRWADYNMNNTPQDKSHIRRFIEKWMPPALWDEIEKLMMEAIEKDAEALGAESAVTEGEELFESWLLKNAWRRLDDNNYAHEYRTFGGFPIYKKTKDLFDEYLALQPSPNTPQAPLQNSGTGEEDYEAVKQRIAVHLRWLSQHPARIDETVIEIMREVEASYIPIGSLPNPSSGDNQQREEERIPILATGKTRSQTIRELRECLGELVEWFDNGMDWFEYPEKADKAKSLLNK